MEDSEKFEEAAKTYFKAINLYKDLPNRSDDVLKNMRSRLSIAAFGANGETQRNTLNVDTRDGEKVTLEILRKRSVKHPRINKNQRVDGARVRAKITLSKNGTVERIDILESMPSQDFSDAFRKAVSTWSFIPPDGVLPEDIPPFEYGMVFYIKRL